jgi:Spy/CpxP family protein refolding chaperone
MRKKHLILIIVVAFAAVSLGGSLAWARGRGAGPFPQGPKFGAFWKDPRLVADLQLTEPQIMELDVLHLKYRRDMIDLRAAMEKAHLDLQQAMQVRPLDIAAAKKAADNITQAQRQIMYLDIEKQAAIQRLLSKEQFDKLKSIAPRGIKYHDPLNRGRHEQKQ